MATILMKASAHRQFASLLSLIRSQMHMLRIQKPSRANTKYAKICRFPRVAVWPAVRDECPLTLRYGIPRGCARGAHAGRSGTLVAAWRHMARWVSDARAVRPPLSTFRRVRKDTEPRTS